MASSIDLATTPAATPPPGITSNLVDPDNQWAHLLRTCVLSWAICVPALTIRIFTKLRVHGRLDYEDYVLTTAMISMVVWTILLLVQPTHGAHIWDTSLASFFDFLYWSNLIIVLYVPSILLAKWAILLQLSRIFSIQPYTGTWWCIRGLIWLSTLFYFTVFWFDVFACVPREKIWNPTTEGHCFSVTAVLVATSLFNIVLNCCIIALPLVLLKRLQMRPEKKITVCAIFAVAGLAGMSSIARLVFSVIFASNNDSTSTIFPVAMAAVAEMSCINFATTFPTMPLFLAYLRGGREAARKKIGYADRNLAARGDRPFSPVDAYPPASSQPSWRGRWFSIGGGDADVENRPGSAAPWESMKIPAFPADIPMTDSSRSGSLRPTESRGTFDSNNTSLLGGVGATKTTEVKVTSVV